MRGPSHAGMIIKARFHPVSFVTGQVPEGSGQVMAFEKKL
jgi:hypothetical protein